MKRTISIFLLLLLSAVSMCVSAETDMSGKLNHITDDAGFFTYEELALYEKTAAELTDEYGCGVYYVSVYDYTEIASGSVADAAQYIFEEFDLGCGEDRDGIILLASDAEGDYGLFRQGSATGLIGDKPLLKDAVGAYDNGGDKGIIEKYLSDLRTYLSLTVIDIDTYVTDIYGLLTQDEKAALEAKAADLSSKYGCGVYIIIVDDYSKYGNGGAFDAACDVFEASGLGEGPNNAGILLMMSMKYRDITIVTNEAAHAMVNADAKDWLETKYLRHFKKDKWFKGYDAYLTKLDTVLRMASVGSPMTYLTYPESVFFAIVAAILGGLGISYIIMNKFKNKLKSVFAASNANEYIAHGGVNISASVDEFSHKTTVRHKVASSGSSGNGSGGGSRSTNSRGFSGKSSKF